MRGTKMIKVHFPNWQFWIFSLTVNLLVVAMQPKSIFAQSASGSSQIQAASNTETASIAPKILSEINRVRTDPQAYAQWLEQQRQYYDGIWLKLPGEKPVRTNRGRKALEEAIAILKEQQPLPPLKSSEQVAAVATSELANFANAKNIQYFSYGRKTATGIVMDLVVDELFPDRRRRQSLLSPEAEDSGVVCKPDPRYAKVCAIAYSDSPAPDSPNNTDVAIVQPEVQPEVPATPNTPSEPPESSAPAATATPAEVTEPEVTEPEVTEPEVVEVEPAAEEKIEEVDTAKEENLAENAAENSTAEKTEEEAVATLPVPPEPQMPPTPSAPPADNQPEIESEPSEVNQAEIESEIEEIAQSERTRTEESAEPEEELEDPETEVEPDEAESSWSDSEPEEVAINTTNIDFSEEGVLEEGDRVIADDGSLYDFYPIEGKAGDSFTINLESDDFDAFVALVDSNGKTIGENDDISQEDSNSQIEITLPEDGVYNVIVNTYDEDGTGQYVLTVSP